MAYKKIEPRLIHLDELCNVCGLFDSETDINNGYGCRSKSKHKQEPGCCYGYDCPLAVSANLADLKKFDKDLYEQYLPEFALKLKNGVADEDCDISSYGEYWMRQFLEVV